MISEQNEKTLIIRLENHKKHINEVSLNKLSRL